MMAVKGEEQRLAKISCSKFNRNKHSHSLIQHYCTVRECESHLPKQNQSGVIYRVAVLDRKQDMKHMVKAHEQDTIDGSQTQPVEPVHLFEQEGHKDEQKYK